MSLLPNQSQANEVRPLYVPNEAILATNVARTTGNISLGSNSTILLKTSLNPDFNTPYLGVFNGTIQLSNIGGATSNMTLVFQATDPNGYVVDSPDLVVTGSNLTQFNIPLVYTTQSSNTQLRALVGNSGAANTGNATITFFTNSCVAPIGQNSSSTNFFNT